MTPLHRLSSTRLARGTAVGFYGLTAQLLLQLVSVPVLTQQWGLATYGAWILLFTVPSLLAMADLGLTTAGANTMIDAAARGDTERATRVYTVLRLVTLLTGLFLMTLAALVLFVWRPQALEFAGHMAAGEGRLTALVLILYGLLALGNGVTLAAFRAADRFALSGLIFHTIILCETVVALTVALSGGTPVQVALAYLLVRLAGTLALSFSLYRVAHWVRASVWRIDRAEFAGLIRPALAALVLPGANAVALQGAVMAIGVVGGPAAVPAYAVLRTLSRSALQFAFRFNIAAMPRYTVFVAQDDRQRAAQLVALNLLVAVVLVLPAAILLMVFGLPFIALWTADTIQPSVLLLTLMVAAMLVNAAWVPLSNLLLAINRHGRFCYIFLIAAIGCVALGALLTKAWNAEGMAVAMLVLEVIMALRVWQLAREYGMVDSAALRLATTELIAVFRGKRATAKDNVR